MKTFQHQLLRLPIEEHENVLATEKAKSPIPELHPTYNNNLTICHLVSFLKPIQTRLRKKLVFKCSQSENETFK
jgi:hypothetical protein